MCVFALDGGCIVLPYEILYHLEATLVPRSWKVLMLDVFLVFFFFFFFFIFFNFFFFFFFFFFF